ncbi:APC family permease [Cohnella suwonensis]|uniref:APC family permease n=1 Tax=Cohnella suwonensis TaxID=696072 RepID=A0ABW0LXQ0_9BACL
MLTQACLLAFVAIFFTAFSYGRMARTSPSSGSAHSYVGRSMHPYMGFLIGWALLLDYLFSPLIACLTFGIFLHTQFPSVPVWVWIVGMNVALAVINIVGVSFSANISRVFVWLQMAFIAVFSAFLFKHLLGGGTAGPIHPLEPLLQNDVPLSAALAGASVICFCFLGFNSVTTMSEETIDAGRAVPKAILIIIAIASILYLVPSSLTQLVGGSGLSALFMTVLVFAIFTQGLASFTTVSRLLFVRDATAIRGAARHFRAVARSIVGRIRRDLPRDSIPGAS